MVESWPFLGEITTSTSSFDAESFTLFSCALIEVTAKKASANRGILVFIIS